MSEPELVEHTDPEHVFAALSDGLRVDILRTLWRMDEAVPFSQLRTAVGTEDSGKFNYHLDKLLGLLVRKTGDGYELTQAGKQIHGAIEAGAYTVEARIEPIELADPCQLCGGVRTLYYRDETVTVDCESCSVTAQFGVPPSVLADRDREEIPAVVGRYLRMIFRRIVNGFCPFCDGTVEPTLDTMTDILDDQRVQDELTERAHDIPHVEYGCKRCGATPTSGLGLVFLDHPAVVHFYYERGIDVRDRPVWEFVGFPPDRQTIRSTDPIEASVTYTAAGEAITLVVDGTLDVRSVQRGDARE